jgi:probable phosphoglycerate mutase
MTLHCPATLFVARHGDAAYHHAHVMSDGGGWLSETGQGQVRQCAEDLRSQRIAAVYSSPMERAVQSGRLAGDLLGVRHTVVDGLQELGVGTRAGQPWSDPVMQETYAAWIAGDLTARVPGAESGAEIVERMVGALQSIADQHRGEQVLVFTHGGVMSLVLPRVSVNVRNDLAHQRFLPNAVPARVEAGDDGWRVITWPGQVDASAV